jgi:hypothetical protein
MIKNNLKFLIGFAVLAFYFFPFSAYSKIGVGVGAGKIIMDEPLMPGGIYTLPDLPVINTGDEFSNYSVSVEYRENVKELRPDKNWIVFYPSNFSLEPGKVQNVKVTINLPTNAKPGDYFAFLQAQPVKKEESGITTSINIAAASKLYFTVNPSNILQALYYRTASLYDKFYPYDAMLLGFIGLIFLISILKSKFNIKISTKKKAKRKRKTKTTQWKNEEQ